MKSNAKKVLFKFVLWLIAVAVLTVVLSCFGEPGEFRKAVAVIGLIIICMYGLYFIGYVLNSASIYIEKVLRNSRNSTREDHPIRKFSRWLNTDDPKK